MKAVQFAHFGERDVLEYIDVATPKPICPLTCASDGSQISVSPPARQLTNLLKLTPRRRACPTSEKKPTASASLKFLPTSPGWSDRTFGRANCPTHRGEVSYVAGQISAAKALHLWITICEGGHLRCLLHDLLYLRS